VIKFDQLNILYRYKSSDPLDLNVLLWCNPSMPVSA